MSPLDLARFSKRYEKFARAGRRGMKRERKRKNGTTRISSKISTRATVPRLTDEFITIADYIRETMEVEYAIEIDNANRVNCKR